MFGKATVHWAVLSDSSLNLTILDRCASELFLAIAIYSFNIDAWDAWCHGSIVLIDVYESFDCWAHLVYVFLLSINVFSTTYLTIEGCDHLSLVSGIGCPCTLSTYPLI